MEKFGMMVLNSIEISQWELKISDKAHKPSKKKVL
jgi:hypothetical protein